MLAWLGLSMEIFWVGTRFTSSTLDLRSPLMKTAVELLSVLLLSNREESRTGKTPGTTILSESLVGVLFLLLF